jgi:gliding motility-associated lipoprotein GldD
MLVYLKEFNTKDSLSTLINAANDLVDEHKIKADRIDFNQIIAPEKKVYGTFFTLRGNVATNYQFYLTDSSSRFIRGEILLNCRPNYDSLRPTLDYLNVDLNRMLQTFRWVN